MLPPQQHDRHRTRGSISDLPPDAGAERPARIAISIVIPARDAAATLDATIGSLLAQRWVEWEAIVVDDGSTDETRTIADAYAARDPRVRVTATGGSGVSAARNAGMALARHPWLLFLDADDTIDPDALERFAGALAAAPEADAAHAGWRYVAPDGTPIGEDRCTSAASDLFALLAARPALAVHACVVRRSVAESAGGWDEALRTSEDFDFWQRIARVGARFVAVPGTLVDYRIRPRGSWLHGEAFLRDRLRVARRGHAPDPRVARADPAHAAGAPAAELPAVEYAAVAWAAGIALTAGEDPVALLEQVAAGAPDVRPTWMAEGLFRSVPLALCRDATCWRDRWPAFAPRIAAFLEATEARAGVRGLARRTETALERWIVDALAGAEPIAPQAARIEAPVLVGATAGVRLDLGAPLPDVRAPGMGRLVIAALLGERSLGAVLVPVCDDLVPRAVLADAIAAEHAWAVLGSHLERHVHPMLSTGDAEGTGRAIRRGDTLLSARPADDESLHDAIGWELFEQELFGAPTWTDARFYDPTCPLPSDAGTIAAATGEPVAVELSAPLPAISSIGDAVDVELLVGGASLGMVRVAAEQGTIGSGALRVALLMAGGMELCRVVVREALVGWPGDDATPLRARLQTRAGAAEAADRPFALVRGTPDADRLARWSRAARAAAPVGGATLVLGRPGAARIGGAASRVAALPAAAADALCDADPSRPAALVGGTDAPAHVLALPALALAAAPVASRANAGADAGAPGGAYDGHYFESLFASGADPWRYTSPYEQTKYEQTLAILPPLDGKRALELACAEGHFTRQLAPRVGSLLAADISRVALARATARCADLPNVSFTRLDIARDDLPGGFDLIVCSEVLYYMGGRAELADVARRMAAALAPGGWLVTAHANVVVDAPTETGFDWSVDYGAKTIGETFAAVRGLRFEREVRTALYRVQLFRRVDGLPLLRRVTLGGARPPKVEVADHAALEAHVADHVLWGGGTVTPEHARAATHRLPILMYHSVAPEGPPALRRWRVTPEAFEAQLAYLREAGFRDATLDEWRVARETSRPLAGRRVLLTFDDGYADFAQHAWPLLRRYGFSALVFLVSDRVGRRADWDAALGGDAPLLSWDTVRALHADGVRFGSHTVSHPELALLDPASLARELAASRGAIERALGAPVDAIAYPYGDMDDVVAHVAGACGYEYGLRADGGPTGPRDRLLALTRVEVFGDDTLERFVARLDG